MWLGGTTNVTGCSFLSNVASTAGLSVAMVGSAANITGSSFDGNQLSCVNGSYRSDTEEVKMVKRKGFFCFVPVVVLDFAFLCNFRLVLGAHRYT